MKRPHIKRTDDGTPIARIMTRRLKSSEWLIMIPRCPYCQAPHEHKGGNGRTPRLGRRRAVCAYAKSYALEYHEPERNRRDDD